MFMTSMELWALAFNYSRHGTDAVIRTYYFFFDFLTRNVNDTRDLYNVSIHPQDRCTIAMEEVVRYGQEFGMQRRHGGGTEMVIVL